MMTRFHSIHSQWHFQPSLPGRGTGSKGQAKNMSIDNNAELADDDHQKPNNEACHKIADFMGECFFLSQFFRRDFSGALFFTLLRGQTTPGTTRGAKGCLIQLFPFNSTKCDFGMGRYPWPALSTMFFLFLLSKLTLKEDFRFGRLSFYGFAFYYDS